MQTKTRLSEMDRQALAGLKRIPAHLATLLVAGLMIGQASAILVMNPILWGAATSIAGVNDVRTDGTLVRAFNIGASGVTATTVNGVLFSAFAFPNSSSQSSTIDVVNFTETAPYTPLVSKNAIGSGSGAFSALPTEYRSLLGSVGGAALPSDVSLSITGLTVGSNYLFQVWANVSENNEMFTIYETATLSQAGTLSSVVLDTNVGNVSGGLGQYAVGTFQANNTNLAVTFKGSSYTPVINAFQLRLVNPVPEPASAIATAALLAGGLLLRRRN